MENSKLADLLKSLETKELRAFLDFVKSPYFNQNQDLVLFCQQLLKAAPAFEGEAIDRYFIWGKLYPGEPYDHKKMGYLMSFLLKLAERFLGQVHYEQDHSLVSFHSLSALHERNLEKHYRQVKKGLGKKLEKSPYRNASFFLQNYRMEELESRQFTKSRLRAFDPSLQDSVNYLDNYYLIAKLKLSCELINRQKILSADYDIRLVDELLAYLNSYPNELAPAVALWRQILLILTDPEQALHFTRFQEQLEQHSGLFPQLELREILGYAQNYCIRQIKKGHDTFSAELFTIYQRGLEYNVFIEDGYLSPWIFKNIVSVALRLKKYQWIEDFIEEYIEKLAPDFKETAYAYNQGYLFYHQKKYESALKSLNRVEFTDVYYSLDTRKIMLMTYWEQGAWEPLISLIASFRIYLIRNKLISEGNREAYSNFLKSVKKLFRYREQGKGEAESLRKEIATTRPIVERDWLLSQI